MATSNILISENLEIELQLKELRKSGIDDATDDNNYMFDYYLLSQKEAFNNELLKLVGPSDDKVEFSIESFDDRGKNHENPKFTQNLSDYYKELGFKDIIFLLKHGHKNEPITTLIMKGYQESIV